jgi:superfamily II DNA/RNA helicase
MSTHFVTNQEKLLADVFNNVLPSTEKLYFLVGYFYFSGFQEIYKNIQDKEVKILVGLDIESNLSNKIAEVEFIQDLKQSRGQVRELYLKSLVSLFNDTDFFDSLDKQEAFNLFLNMIVEGRLEIRKSLQANHAKLYLFENKQEYSQGGEFPGTVITGSSNLTYSGLRGRFEINVISRDAANYIEAMRIFTQLWEQSVPIVDKTTVDIFKSNVVEKIWIDKLYTPFSLYVRVLDEYFSLPKEDAIRLPGDITRQKYINLKYQVDAIQKAIHILKKHNGVIIADVVGLGKSIIAAAVAHNLNKKVRVICPPHLKDQWYDYCDEFDFTAKIYTSGKIEEALRDNQDDEEKLIIIDEAHKYRNDLTADYADLHKLCQRNKVMLISATPFSNRPQDIFTLVKLFQIPTRSTIQTVDNLSHQFRELIKEYKRIKELQKQGIGKEEISKGIKQIAEQIRKILYPLVIRRSRLDLEEIKEYRDNLVSQKISFPKVNDPVILDYHLGELSDLYEETLKKISPDEEEEDEKKKAGFIGARYMPTKYIKNFETYRERIAKEMGVDENLLRQSQINLAIFMRRLLVRRFESSIHAFQKTLDSLIHQAEIICKWYEELGKIPIYKKGKLPDIDGLIDAIDKEQDQELKETTLEKELQAYQDKGLWTIEKKELRKGFIDDVKKDIELLTQIRQRWFGNGPVRDPKLARFKELLREKLKNDPNRKIIVFTEFSDTANYLYEQIKNEFRVFKYSSEDSNRTNKEIIRENFDAGYKTQKNDFDVLIATDAISEGFNLHRAGIVFNYDIPYNPTRVIQRVGRINRINKKVFDELYIYNFFPTATGERETRVKEISTLKIAMVHALFGEDTKVLTKDEEIESFFAKQFRDEQREQEEISPETRYENFIRQLRIEQPDIIEMARNLPKRCRIRRTISQDRQGVIVFGKKGGEYTFKFAGHKDECLALGGAEALELFEADLAEKSEKPGKTFQPIYEHLKANLFTKRSQVAMDKGKQKTLEMVRAIKDRLPDTDGYLADLDHVISQLDALPERYARMIRAIDGKKLERDLAELKKEVPHSYLLAIIEREQKIDEGKETLILSEELI